MKKEEKVFLSDLKHRLKEDIKKTAEIISTKEELMDHHDLKGNWWSADRARVEVDSLVELQLDLKTVLKTLNDM